MGLLGDLWDGAKSVFKAVVGDDSSSRQRDYSSTKSSTSVSNTQTMYEPDRVKVAELENAKMDKAIEAQKEIIQMNNEMQLYIIEAHQKGFEHSAQILKEMMISMNEIAQERLMLIENEHFEVVDKIEKLYLGLEKEIREDNDDFNMDKLPQMLEILSKFEVGSPSAKLYEKSVDKQIELNSTFFTQKLGALHERQKLIVVSAIASKEQVLEHSSQIVEERMKFLDKQLSNQQNMQHIPNKPQQINLASNDAVKLIEE